MSTRTEHDVTESPVVGDETPDPHTAMPRRAPSWRDRFDRVADRVRSVLEPVWKDRRIGVAATVGVAASWGVLAGLWTPRGPLTTGQAIWSILISLVVGKPGSEHWKHFLDLAYWNVELDDAGAIGRRYRRQDEIGTPFCVTVDFDTLEDQAVTVRERDSMAQERVPLAGLRAWLAERLPVY